MKFQLTPWPNNNAHWLFSVAVAFGCKLFTPPAHYSPLYALVGCIAWALVKELIIDIDEGQATIDAALDAGFYSIGAIGAAIALHFVR